MPEPSDKFTWQDCLDPNYYVPIALIGGLGLFLLWALLPVGIYDYAPDFMLPKNPLREPVFWMHAIPYKEWELTPMRRYVLDARMLGKHEYGQTETDNVDLAPIDMYFGWGPMADINVLKYLSLNIHNRVAYTSGSWSIAPLHISMDELRLHSDNNHLIPATPEIEQRLRAAPVGALIHLEGYFVDARMGNEGYWRRWTSSLSYGWSHGTLHPNEVVKTCKLIYVTKFDIEQ
jgi:hypothetical protein